MNFTSLNSNWKFELNKSNEKRINSTVDSGCIYRNNQLGPTEEAGPFGLLADDPRNSWEVFPFPPAASPVKFDRSAAARRTRHCRGGSLDQGE
jgi:hypothetical protein